VQLHSFKMSQVVLYMFPEGESVLSFNLHMCWVFESQRRRERHETTCHRNDARKTSRCIQTEEQDEDSGSWLRVQKQPVYPEVLRVFPDGLAVHQEVFL